MQRDARQEMNSPGISPLVSAVSPHGVVVLLMLLCGLFLLGHWGRVVLFLFAGLQIYVAERRLGFPALLSPCLLFWAGNAACFVLGPVLLMAAGAFDTNSDEFYRFGFYYVYLGMTALYAGLLAASSFSRRKPMASVDPMPVRLTLGRALAILVIWFTASVLIWRATPGDSLGYLAGGFMNHVWLLPCILAGISLMRAQTASIAPAVVLFVASLLPGAVGLVRGGRGNLVLAVIFLLLFYWNGAILRRRKLAVGLAIGSVACLVAVYINVAGIYRGGGVYEGAAATSWGEKYERLSDAYSEWREMPEGFMGTLQGVGARFYEQYGFELLHMVRDRENLGRHAEPLLESVVRMATPAWLLPEKFVRSIYGVLQAEGILLSYQNCPLTLVADTCYRYGGGGVLLFYFMMGLCLTFLGRALYGSSQRVLRVTYFTLLPYIAHLYMLGMERTIGVYIVKLPLALIAVWALESLIGLGDPARRGHSAPAAAAPVASRP